MVSDFQLDFFQKLTEPLERVLGAKTAKALASLKLYSVRDLMYHIPRRYLSATESTDLSAVQPGEDVAVIATISKCEQYEMANRKSRAAQYRLIATLTDATGYLNVVFFGSNARINYWKKQLVAGGRGIFVGKVTIFNNSLQMTHPDFVLIDDEGSILGSANQEKMQMMHQVQGTGLIGIYPANSKIRTWQIAQSAQLVLDLLRGVNDPMAEEIRQEYELLEIIDAFNQIHRPNNLAQIEKAKYRLKFDEALALQTTMALRREQIRAHQAPVLKKISGASLDNFDARLPFELTGAQQRAGEQIAADLAKTEPMARLLQGEVGSGKTIVALRAMLQAVDNDKQAVLIAPTQVLAEQHFNSISRMLGDLGAGEMLSGLPYATEIVLLNAAQSSETKRRTLLKIADGQAGIVIGTHALFSEKVSFADLGLVVIDEQHRFGVAQRDMLNQKAKLFPHNLVMTATPIPRSIAMTAFGDLEVSTLDELPTGRKPVQTTMLDLNSHAAWLDRAWQRIREEVAEGRQVFIVCPRIKSTDQEPDVNIAKPSAAIEQIYPYLANGPLKDLKLGVLHAQLDSVEQNNTMSQFIAGRIDVLIATTIIEVGVDVPNASMMVILDADRFGISQLHQLRGRIGRGSHPGLCLLVTQMPTDSKSVERLSAVAATNDGFQLAQLDLAARREGNVLGSQQSGSKSALKLLRITDDIALVELSGELAKKIVGGNQWADWVADMVTATKQEEGAEWLEKN